MSDIKKSLKPIKTVVKCGYNTIENIFNKLVKQRTKSEKIPSTSVVKKTLPTNPYMASITGTYAFDLTKISEFKVYFWKSSDNPKTSSTYNPVIDSMLGNDTAVNWEQKYIDATMDALKLYTDFFNKPASIVSVYADCDIVCVLGGGIFDFLGSCYGPKYVYEYPTLSDGKVLLFMENSYMNTENVKRGGQTYLTLIHELGHGFGLAHPHDTGFGSKLMPGISSKSNYQYPAFSAYGQNHAFNTVMSYNDNLYFSPQSQDFDTCNFGYPESLMPLDAVSLKYMYGITTTPVNYITNYGVSNINPILIQNKCQMIVGLNRTVSFGDRCESVSFFFSNQKINANNCEPVIYEFNRVLEKAWGFYPKDIGSTISTLNFSNTDVSNVFIEPLGMKVNLKINLLKNKVFNMYIRDLRTNYKIVGNKYTNNASKLDIEINNTIKAKINVFFG
uniref:Peptidase metallopeptidase domain-containing protein n=1 Tax=viral metagenome TaxID=1070528 RepID=A0A6C0I1Y2_9ZZZZ